MTILLKQAFEKASQLPDDLQDQLAQEVLEDIAGELQWDTTLAQSEDLLEQLAAQALREFEAGAPVRRGLMSCELPSYRGFRRAFSRLPRRIQISRARIIASGSATLHTPVWILSK